jgi:predicted esterase
VTSQIDLPPQHGPAEQLFILLHGVGAAPEAMLPLAQGACAVHFRGGRS